MREKADNRHLTGQNENKNLREANEVKMTIKAICGDTICEREKEETYENCREDCTPQSQESMDIKVDIKEKIYLNL